MTDEPDLQGEELQALDRIARSYDGLLLHRFLRRVLEACVDFQDSGALRTQNGRRSLARDLMRHMAQGIEAQTRGSADAAIIPPGKSRAAVADARARQREQFAAAWDAEQREFESTFNPGGV